VSAVTLKNVSLYFSNSTKLFNIVYVKCLNSTLPKNLDLAQEIRTNLDPRIILTTLTVANSINDTSDHLLETQS
jgi:hypothetical protein